MATEQHWDKMYEMPLENIPWEIAAPPDELVALIEAGKLEAGNALDVACGTGNYTIYLAQHGFEAVGVDFSKKAISIAERNAKALALPASFLYGDVRKLLGIVGERKFEFILDYSLLHHIAPSDVAEYTHQFVELLKPGGALLMVCYSEKDDFSDGKPNATGKYGNEMFYRTRADIEKLYSGLEVVEYRETRLGKRRQHFAHCFLFRK